MRGVPRLDIHHCSQVPRKEMNALVATIFKLTRKFNISYRMEFDLHLVCVHDYGGMLLTTFADHTRQKLSRPNDAQRNVRDTPENLQNL